MLGTARDVSSDSSTKPCQPCACSDSWNSDRSCARAKEWEDKEPAFHLFGEGLNQSMSPS